MKNLKEVLGDRYQGLPGIGINGKEGESGRKGNSIYIGYLRSFFDYQRVKYPGYVYTRIKNMAHTSQTDPEFYYRNDGNFYKKIVGVDDTHEQMVTFSIYNVRGLFFDKSSYETSSKVTYKSLVKSDDFWKRNMKNPDGSYVTMKGYSYIGVPDDWTENEINNWKKRDIDVDDVNFPIRLEESYIEERDKADSQTNYSTVDDDGIVIPTTLKSIFNPGDILYLQDDITSKVISYLIVTEDLIGMSFSKFLEQEFISCESLMSTFAEMNNRAVINKVFYLPVVKTGESVPQEIDLKFKENFIKRLDGDFLFNIPCNNDKRESDKKFFELFCPVSNKSLTVNHNNTEDSFTEVEDNIVLKASNLKLENLFIKNIDTNINIKEYNNSGIKYIGGYGHVKAIDNNNLTVSENFDKIKIQLSSISFFESFSEVENGFYGVEIYRKTSNGYDFVKKVQLPSSESSIYFELDDSFFVDGKNYIGFITYVTGTNISTSYSKISELELDCSKKDNNPFRISKYTFLQSSTSVTNISDDFNNDYCSFVLSDLSCEKCDDATLSIESNTNAVIKNVYINNTLVISEGKIVKEGFEGSWIEFDASNAIISDDGKRVEISKIRVDENIPDIEEMTESGLVSHKPKSIGECLYYLSQHNYHIGQSIQETIDRSMVLTVMTYEKSTSSSYRSSFVITQPGFENPLKDVSVSFSNRLLDNQIEDCNKSSNGILCNQIQYFVELNYHNFNVDTWGKYFENPRIRVAVDLDTQTTLTSGGIEYSGDTNLNNVHIYSVYDKVRYPNNAFKTMFYWLNGNSGNSINSLTSDLNDNSHELKKLPFIEKNRIKIEPDVDNHWISLNDSVSNRKTLDTTIPYDIFFEVTDTMDGTNCIGGRNGLTFSDVNNSNDKVKIRTVCEIANPIPMEFNFRWKVTRIDILGELKGQYKEVWKKIDSNADVEETMVFRKYYSREILSDNTKFIINPVYTTLCPSDKEEQSEIKGAVKKVGSEEGLLIETGIIDIDERTKKEFYDLGYDDVYIRYTQSRFVSSMNMGSLNISDITYYRPKMKYLQDNVKNISVTPKNLRDNIQQGIIKASDSSFFTMSEYLRKNLSFTNGQLNLFPIDWNEDEVNPNCAQNYIELMYNADVMNPTLREGALSFYYNNNIYPYVSYNQRNTASPLWVNQTLVSQAVSDDYIESKKVWNFEYESSSVFNKNNVFGGVLTKSGNGYMQLFEDTDYGQYEDDKIISLSELQSFGEKYIFDKPVLQSMSEPEGYLNQPQKEKFFRSFALKADWVYPYFVKFTEDEIKVIPYTIINPYESYIDSMVMDGIMSINTNSLREFINGKIKDVSIFCEGRDASVYFEKKVNTKVWSIQNGGTSTIVEDTTSLNMLIPYNLLFDVYPRTMYNTDMGSNTVNVLMLQQPCVVKNGNYKFDKHYFEISENDKVELLSPLNFNV